MNVQQGSAEWKRLRVGYVTASRFSDVCKDPREKWKQQAGRLAASSETYAYELLFERGSGEPFPSPVTAAMRWGIEQEPYAREAASLLFDVREPVGDLAFCRHESEPWIGCSLDGLADDGTLEIKCPFNPANHLRAIYDPDWFIDQNRHQCLGGLWIMKKSVCYLCSFDPRYTPRPLHVVPVNGDEDDMMYMMRKVTEFRDRVAEMEMEKV